MQLTSTPISGDVGFAALQYHDFLHYLPDCRNSFESRLSNQPVMQDNWVTPKDDQVNATVRVSQARSSDPTFEMMHEAVNALPRPLMADSVSMGKSFINQSHRRIH